MYIHTNLYSAKIVRTNLRRWHRTTRPVKSDWKRWNFRWRLKVDRVSIARLRFLIKTRYIYINLLLLVDKSDYNRQVAAAPSPSVCSICAIRVSVCCPTISGRILPSADRPTWRPQCVMCALWIDLALTLTKRLAPSIVNSER